MKLTQHDLLEAGCSNDPQLLSQLLSHAKSLQKEKHINDLSYLLKHLKRDFPSAFGALSMRDHPAPLSLAIEANTPEEIKNLNKAKIQLNELLKSPVIESGTLMPDACPAGSAPASMPVGGAIAVRDAIIPAAHSSDICCSLHASFFLSDLSITELLDALQAVTRFGPGGRQPNDYVHHDVLDEEVWDNPFLSRLQQKAAMHMADQGDGNHFAYLGEMEITSELLESLHANGKSNLAESLQAHSKVKVLVTHHGSRGLGAAVYERGLNAAIKHTRKHAKDIPSEAAWLSMQTQQGRDYWNALQYVERWTKANHVSIHGRFLEKIDSPLLSSVGNEHNFVWKRGNLYLHGKGATPAWNDANENPLLGLIPLNMAEPILLTLGSNNAEHLSFSPHGAGRNLSRTALVRKYQHKKRGFDKARLEQDIAESTQSIETRWYQGHADITECPLAYKPASEIKKQIAHYNLATVIAEIKPLGCIMAGRVPKTDKPLTPKQLRQIEHRANRRKSRQRDWLE